MMANVQSTNNVFRHKQKIKYELNRLLRSIDNRLCADCSDPLVVNIIQSSSGSSNPPNSSSASNNNLDANQSTNAFALLKYAVWVCKKCMLTHRKVIDNAKVNLKCKSILDDWDEEELDVMIKGGSNRNRNKTLERYLPKKQLMAKITSKSTEEQRQIWIQAKYIYMLFMIPQENALITENGIGKVSNMNTSTEKRHAERANTEATLPTRVIDFFIILGPGKLLTDSSPVFVAEETFFEPTIVSTCPHASFHSDFSIPEMLPHFSFPTGLCLSSVELPPISYSIVLTDISRVKLYCSVLIIYELLDPMKLEEMLGPQLSEGVTTSVYAPKALVLLSHYPFYHLFSTALKQLYRISLSEAPLPMERFIMNIVHEIPLPPPGQVEVAISIADVICQIKRPQPNQLPMVDFSYRPLFIALSVESILLIFRFLCAEYSVCFYSSQLAILTPIQEAFLSFLFPFIWQGVFIPILEDTVLDIIEAPVPYVVGLLSHQFTSRSVSSRNPNAIFVEIDNDTITFGTNTDYLQPESLILKDLLPAMPPQALAKLRLKLQEFGGIIHKSVSSNTIKNMTLAFPNNEHLIPLPYDSFLDHGVAKRNYTTNTINTTNSHNGSFIGMPSSSHMKKVEEYNQKHPTMCTQSYYKVYNSSSKMSVHDTSRRQKLLPLDPSNNSENDDDTFDAREIRGAFLRFFIACVSRNYEFFMGLISQTLQPDDVFPIKSKKSKFFTTASASATISSLSSSTSITSNPTNANNEDIAVVDELLFLRSLCKTQMFSNYRFEKVSNPQLSEILFFDESIIEKRNRSLFARKSNTPFLDDQSFVIRELFTCPSPSTWGIPSVNILDDIQVSSSIGHERGYVYSQFPIFVEELMGPIRATQVFVQQPEIHRSVIQSKQASSILQGLHQKYKLTYLPKPLVDTSSKLKEMSLQEWMLTNYRHVRHMEDVVRLLQRRFQYLRSIKARKRCLRACLLLQRWIRRHQSLKKRLNKLKLQSLEEKLKYVIICQSFIRMVISRQNFKMILRCLIQLQAFIRRFKALKLFQKYKKSSIVITKNVRRYLSYSKSEIYLFDLHKHYRTQLLYLWKMERSPLYHRTAFWIATSDFTYFNTSLCQEEVLRLYIALDLFAISELIKLGFTKEVKVYDLSMILETSIFYKQFVDTSCKIRLFTSKLTYTTDAKLSSLGLLHVQQYQDKEVEERRLIYQSLQGMIEDEKDVLYRPFELQSAKKRKQTLANSIWVLGSKPSTNQLESLHSPWRYQSSIDTLSNEIEASIRVIEATNTYSLSTSLMKVQMEYIDFKRRKKINKALLEVSRAFLCKPKEA